MINVICLQNDAREFRKQVRFFIGDAARAHHANHAIMIADFRETLSDQLKSFFPVRRSEFPILSDERLHQTVRMMSKIECVPAFDAQKIIINAALIAIVAAHDLHAAIGAAHT